MVFGISGSCWGTWCGTEVDKAYEDKDLKGIEE